MLQMGKLLVEENKIMQGLVPEYNEDIIVGVYYDNFFNWYVTDKEIWFLDYKKRIDAFKKWDLK